MATHKSAAVAARQRVNDHFQQQIEQLTAAVENGIKAADQISKIDDERDAYLASLEAKKHDAQRDLDAAVDQLRSLGKTKPEIAELLDIDPKLVTSRRRRGATTTQPQADTMPHEQPATDN